MSNSKPKFTPGPWRVNGVVQNSKHETFGYAIDHFSEDHDGFETVAITYNAKTPEDEANAALIAAAPEMYDALEVAAAELEQCEPNDEYPEMQMAYRNIMGQIKSALKKARGES